MKFRRPWAKMALLLSIVAVGHKGMERKPFNEEHLQWEKIHLGKYGNQ